MAKITNKIRKVPKKFTTHKCNICSKKFTEKAGLNQHIQTHSSERPFVCNICTSSFKTKKYLSRHIKKVHNPAIDHECRYCGKKFHYESILKQHMYIHTDERPYKCKVCCKGFNSKYTLNNHSYIHTDTKPFNCEFCDYACRDSSTLRKHQQRHMGIVKRYQCTLCDKSYSSKSRLTVHVTEVHLEINVNKWKCDNCNKVFKSSKVLKSHVKNVHERAYACKCEICGAIMSNKYNLPLHMSRHVNLRPYICNFNHCAKRFKDKCSLKKHILLHYPEKHLQCEMCNKTFSRSDRLRLHLNQHKAKTKGVFCDYCGTSFYNKNYLIKHISKKHLHKMKFVCDKCGFETSNKPSLVMHIKSGHESELDRKCKICNKIYKKHIYLKAHYWKTHCVRYNMTIRKTKLKKRGVIIKEEPIEYLEREFLSELEVLVEEMSDTEEKTTDWKTDLNKYFTEQIVKPGSIIKEKRDNNIKVDVKCQKQAKIYLKKLLEKKRRRRQMKELENIRKEYNRRLKKLIGTKVTTKIRFVRNNNNDNIESNDEITNINNDENNKTVDNIIEKEDINYKSNENDNENGSNDNNLSDVTAENHLNIDSTSTNHNENVNDKNVKNDSNNENNVLYTFLNENELNNEINYNIGEETIKQDSKLKLNTHQCYVCFKLYETKEKLIVHCQEHFDICNINNLKKCPLCDYVTKGDLKRHILSIHRINLKTWLKLKKNSTMFDNTDDNINIKIIPSVKSLNKQAYVKLDKLAKKKKESGLTKKSLVKQNGEWIIKNEIDTDYKKYIMSKDIINENKCKIIMASTDYLDRLKMLYRVVKENDGKMLFPCEKCEKICQTLSALKLHMRKHDMNPRPFKKKIWKHKLIGENREKQRETEENENAEKQINIAKNRYENPKPIRSKHKCDNELKEFYNNNIKGGDIEFWHFLKVFNKMTKENVSDAPESMGIIEIGKKETGKLSKRNSFKRTMKDVKRGINRRILISKKEYERRKLMIERLRKKNLEN